MSDPTPTLFTTALVMAIFGQLELRDPGFIEACVKDLCDQAGREKVVRMSKALRGRDVQEQLEQATDFLMFWQPTLEARAAEALAEGRMRGRLKGKRKK